MGKHRAIPQHSLQARTVIGGVLAGGALLISAPAGMALAKTRPAPGNPTTQTAALQTKPQELDKRLIAAIETSKFGQALGQHLETGSPRDQQFAVKLFTFLNNAP